MMDQTADNKNTPGDGTLIGFQHIINITLLDDKVNFKILSPFKINKSISLISRTWDWVRYTNNYTTLTIKENSEENVDKFLQLNKIEINELSYNIKVQKVLPSIHSKGVIYSKGLLVMTDEEILRTLKSQNVEEVYRFTKQIPSGKWIETGSFSLTFSMANRPKMVKIIFLNLQVYPLIQKPMFCTHCFLIGHTAKRCKSTHRIYCKICFYAIDSNTSHECCKICKNCEESHGAEINSCPTFAKELKILQLKSIEEISYMDAKNRINIESINGPQKETGMNFIKELEVIASGRELSQLVNVEPKNEETISIIQLLTKENDDLKAELAILIKKSEINKKLTGEILLQLKESNETNTKLTTINKQILEQATKAQQVVETFSKQLETSKFWSSCMKKFIDKNEKTAAEFQHFMKKIMNDNGSSDDYEEEFEE